ncbi:hypothetical protein GCM10009789_68540 [Kribbella sancticallisti]|uniref:Uncharacterized protein n=1 Tax=Kribbella sancticallisti TaxID=460087 RepID=A0ABP4QCL3_9ACTN
MAVAAGFGAQRGDGVVGDDLPVQEEAGCALVEEQEPGDVERGPFAVQDPVVQGIGGVVGGEDAVADVGRRGERVEDPQDTGAHLGHCGTAGAADRAGRGPGEVEQVGSFGVVEAQGPREGLEDLFGDSGEVAALCLVRRLQGCWSELRNLVTLTSRGIPAPRHRRCPPLSSPSTTKRGQRGERGSLRVSISWTATSRSLVLVSWE